MIKDSLTNNGGRCTSGTNVKEHVVQSGRVEDFMTKHTVIQSNCKHSSSQLPHDIQLLDLFVPTSLASPAWMHNLLLYNCSELLITFERSLKTELFAIDYSKREHLVESSPLRASGSFVTHGAKYRCFGRFDGQLI